MVEETREYTEIITRPDAAFFLAYAEGTAIGFAQCQLRRDYVEGTQFSPVGYLEGIYVADNYRKRALRKRFFLPGRMSEIWPSVSNMDANTS